MRVYKKKSGISGIKTDPEDILPLRDRKVNRMEQAKKRIRICLICVVTAAILIGIFYYVMTQRQTVSEDNGTLVSVQMTEGGNNETEWGGIVHQRG